MCFVNSMSDLFHEALPTDAIDQVFGVMALCQRITFQVLTKRPERMLKYLTTPGLLDRIAPQMAWYGRENNNSIGTAAVTYRDMMEERWPLPNVWLGTSVEDWITAEKRVAILQKVPASVRFISQEPQIDYIEWHPSQLRGIHWLIQGGESGPGARPFNLKWVRTTRQSCKDAGTAYFLKQLGAKPVDTDPAYWQHKMRIGDGNSAYSRYIRVPLKDRKGGSMAEWPKDLQDARAFPLLGTANVEHGAAPGTEAKA